MTEADARVLLHNWPGVGDVDAWIAGRRWHAAEMGRLQPHGFAYLHERAMRDGVLDAAEHVLSMQFSGPVPALNRR
jgi:hypothetical protein